MDPQTFNSLKTQIKKPFFSDKKEVLQTFLQNHWFSGSQAAEVIGEFPHASEKTEVLSLIEPRLTVLTGAEAKNVVAAFTFAGGKLKAVELVANHINDPNGKYSVLEAIDFHFDKEKARKILDASKPPVAPCQPYCNPQCPPGQPYGQPPSTQCYQAPPRQAYQPPPGAAPYQPPPGQAYQPPPGAAPYQPPPGQAYQPPPPQGTPYQAPYQPPVAGYPPQGPYGAPPSSQYPSPYGVPPGGMNPGYSPPGAPGYRYP